MMLDRRMLNGKEHRRCAFCIMPAAIEYNGDIWLCDKHDSAIKAASLQEVLLYIADLLEIEEVTDFEDFKSKLKETGLPYKQKYLNGVEGETEEIDR